ncbi:DUF4153 domain-containing protein [Clostridiaceae bacterium UIB06]|uniref:DUF4153 domain-containing protein n=1 Tax=Clostridium thailandense TaxID=2794346 RepID=A0A949TYQ3_9CLOT|nr:DUF4153 domain-containing protein [Clostridium thailandense]MBV7274261.1 DUF4153 domain-containing protein [Clostridium thailandense]MCH5136161.1 DUF4153 domain-containing protein [Clostridiaceae bacterium UIB06]
MKIALYMKKILSGFYLSIKRFPLTIAFSASTALVLILISETVSKDNLLKRVAMIFALGIPVSLCIKLCLEKIDERNIYKTIIYYLSGILLLIVYYFLFLKTMDMLPITRYIAVSASLYLAFLFIPYLLKREQFEMYIIVVFTSFFVTMIYSIVLYSGLSAILFTIDKLLGIRILGKIYYYTWLFVIFIFFLLYFLSQIPDNNEKIITKSYPKLLRILILYIIMPLLTTYTIILYIYFGKIAVTAQWPVGIVSHLVLWYSIIVTIVLFFITPIKSENSWSSIFLKLSPKIILPPIIMMFISIGIRINAYGVTERRYFVAILGIWLFFIMIYLSFTKRPENIIIPTTLSIVILISVFGPQSSYEISKMSQNSRFEKILIKNEMIKDDKIQSKPNVSQNDKYEISNILDYFEKNHSLNDVKHIPKGFKLDDMSSVFGFPFMLENYGSPMEQFNFVRNDSKKYIDITGYDYFFDVKNLSNDSNMSSSYLIASYNYDTSIIKIIYKGNEIYTKNLNSFVQNLIDKYGVSSKGNSLSSEEMTLIEENEKVKVKFIFSNIFGNRSEGTNAKGFDFYMLVKIKK